MRIAVALLVMLLTTGPLAAQDAAEPVGIPVPVVLETTLTSKTAKAGETFPISVTQDVSRRGTVIIPIGSRGEGRVIWRTGNGGYGKSGKLEIEFTKVSANGVELPLTGKFRMEGQGRPGAILVGGLFLKGNNAVIEKGRKLTAYVSLK